MLRLNTFQLFLSSSAAFFLVVLFTHFNAPDGLAGVGSNLSGAITRGSVKGIMAKSEQLWMKTVKQRREVWDKFGEMGL